MNKDKKYTNKKYQILFNLLLALAVIALVAGTAIPLYHDIQERLVAEQLEEAGDYIVSSADVTLEGANFYSYENDTLRTQNFLLKGLPVLYKYYSWIPQKPKTS